MLDFAIRMACAENIANTELRYLHRNDAEAAESAHARLYRLMEEAPYPNVAISCLAARLGRHKALAVGITLR